jgi:reductive dehalogenase
MDVDRRGMSARITHQDREKTMGRRSTVSNKTRMKAMGLDHGHSHSEEEGRARFHDLDEVMASPSAEWKRPWWVSEVAKPTLEIDWDATERFDARKIQQISWRKYIGDAKADELTKRREEKMHQWIIDNKPGYTLRDRALDIASRQAGAAPVTFRGSWAKGAAPTVDENTHFNKEAPAPKLADPWSGRPASPREMGVPRWEGSAQENARMIRAAARHFGADQVGFVELNDQTRKLIYEVDALDGKRIEFENVETAYETDAKRVIPDKARWVIVFSIKMSEELIKRKSGPMPTALSSAATGAAYGQARNVIDRLQNFLHVLGYQGLMGTWYNGLGIAPAFAVLAGLGELGRINRMISPEYGPLQRVFKIVTDLPLEPTKPIDAGIMNFCRTCKVCADECPADCLSKETEPYWEPAGPWNNPGHRTWYEDSPSCRTWWAVSTAGCSTCFAVCAFSKKNKSVIHDIVKIAIAKNRFMPDQVNRFFTKMDGVFGYHDQRDIEDWWDMDLPPRGTKAAKGTLLD